MCAGTAAGVVGPKKPRHIIKFRFSEVVNDHAKGGHASCNVR